MLRRVTLSLEFCTAMQTMVLDAVKMTILEVLLIVQLLPTCHAAGKKMHFKIGRSTKGRFGYHPLKQLFYQLKNQNSGRMER